MYKYTIYNHGIILSSFIATYGYFLLKFLRNNYFFKYDRGGG